jgi:hypothetical protein
VRTRFQVLTGLGLVDDVLRITKLVINTQHLVNDHLSFSLSSWVVSQVVKSSVCVRVSVGPTLSSRFRFHFLFSILILLAHSSPFPGLHRTHTRRLVSPQYPHVCFLLFASSIANNTPYRGRYRAFVLATHLRIEVLPLTQPSYRTRARLGPDLSRRVARVRHSGNPMPRNGMYHQ